VSGVNIEAVVAPDAPLAEKIEQLARFQGEPAWLAEQRRRAWERVEALPVPATRTEGWRRTDLSGLDLDRLTRQEARRHGPAQDGTVDAASLGEVAGSLTLVDGVLAERWLDPELERRGVLLMPLDQAVRDQPELVERYLGHAIDGGDAGEDSKFVALAAALWSNGVFLYVPRGVGIERPIVGRSIMASGEPSFFRGIVVAAEGADVTYIDERQSGEGAGEALASGLVEIFAEQATRVRYADLQGWNRHTWHFNRTRAVTGRDARLDWLVVATGGRLHRAELEASLQGQGSETEMVGLIFGDEDQHFDHQTVQNHFGNDTRSNLDFKAALGDGASSNYTGMIRVNKEALRTNSNLENRNLLLSDHSRAESDPRLEILNSDVVRCAHGATVGPLDPEMLFYIQTRGIPRDEARRLVVEAFFEPVLRQIPVEAIKDNVWRSVQRKLGREIGRAESLLTMDPWPS
jgi:Fe-S cluster assembly protein SufD